MQKWEYSVIKGFGTDYPALFQYGREKTKLAPLSRNSTGYEPTVDHIWEARALAELGAEGWELVGVTSRLVEDRMSENLFFKRPLEDSECWHDASS